jgi:glucose/arabinose dehydrogenase
MSKRKATIEKMRYLVRRVAASLLVSALLTQASYAQENFPESERQKAETAKKKADEKATDEAYKATIRRSPVVKQKTDPWGSLRTPSANGSK